MMTCSAWLGVGKTQHDHSGSEPALGTFAGLTARGPGDDDAASLDMTAARHRWLRSAASPGVAVSLLVVLLSVAGFVVTRHLVEADRAAAARQRAANDAQQIQGLLGRAATFIDGIASALAGAPAPDQTHFESLLASETGTYLLADAMWVERVRTGERRRYEARIHGPIRSLPGTRREGPAHTYFPATFVTGLRLRPGTDVSALSALASALRNSDSALPGATDAEVVARQRGFFLVETAQFGQGPGSSGFLVVFVPADWLTLASTLSLERTRSAWAGVLWPGRSAAGQPAAGALPNLRATGGSTRPRIPPLRCRRRCRGSPSHGRWPWLCSFT